ncbi:MAG: PQQ-binding-like beta-propeller repeat protein [Planctomycetota bacterium]
MSVCLLLACSLLSPGSGPAVEPDAVGDWPTFLGPSGDGIAAAKTLKTAVPDAASVLAWTEEIGEGYSAPVVVTLKGSDEEEPRRVLFSHRREGRQETLTRRDLATGKTEWTVAAPTAFRDPYGYNGGPRASPLAVPNAAGDGGFVYTLGAAGRASCVDIKTGEERWSRDFNAELNIPRWFFGVGGSPVLFEPQTTANPRGEPLVIFAPGGQPNAGVVAVKPDTGETVWEAVGCESTRRLRNKSVNVCNSETL